MVVGGLKQQRLLNEMITPLGKVWTELTSYGMLIMDEGLTLLGRNTHSHSQKKSIAD